MIDQILLGGMISGVSWIAWALTANDYGTSHITRWERHYDKVLEAKGATLRALPGGSDDAPCEIRWELNGPSYRYVARGWKMLRVLRKIKRGHDLRAWLEAHSTHEYCKVPQ